MEQYQRGWVAHPPHPGLEALDDALIMLDRDWRVTYWNGAAERMLGQPRERALARPVQEVIPSLSSAVVWDQIERVRVERVPGRFLHRSAQGPGSASIHVAPLADGGVALQIRDAAAEVKHADQHAALLESIHDGFVAVDAQWQIVYLNSVAESLLRFPRDRAVGMSLWSLLPDEPQEIGQCLRATLDDGIQRHLRNVRPEGRVFHGRIFDLWTHPLAGGGVSLFIEDVSDRIQREKELSRLAAEAQEANEAKSRFFAAISHELRTPLNAIVGYTHLLGSETYGPMTASARRAAERVGICAEHLSRLVDDVLLLTTAEIGRLPVSASPVVLQDFLPSIVSPLRLQAQAKGLSFDLEVPEDLPPVETDPQRLRQLLLALISNAVKFTARGRIGVRASLCDPSTDVLPERGEYSLFPDEQVEIVVTDTGPGVAAEHRERIFGPFEQLGDPARSDSMSRGTGLGLTIARQLAQLLRGRLYLAETSRDGSRFCLRIPVRYYRS